MAPICQTRDFECCLFFYFSQKKGPVVVQISYISNNYNFYYSNQYIKNNLNVRMNHLNSQHNEDKNCKTNLFLYNNYLSFSGYVLPIVENTFLSRSYTSSSVLPHDGSFPLLYSPSGRLCLLPLSSLHRTPRSRCSPRLLPPGRSSEQTLCTTWTMWTTLTSGSPE